jgi:DNA polymerase I-like protein with 3'-5' exonuclease and polymerase domains
MDQLGMFLPKSNWKPPTEFPTLDNAKMIAFDVETYDPNLLTQGPGGVRRDGKLVGISVRSDCGFCGYFPFGHEGGDNLEKEKVLRWAKDILGRDIEYVGANISYDMEWLRAYDIDVKGTLRDIQIAEPLINEESEGGYSLSTLAKRYLGEDKNEDLLIQAAQAHGVDPKGGLWKLPARYVGPYAEADADLPYNIWLRQIQKLRNQDLWEIFELESALTRVILDMRFRGVAVDIDKAEQLNEQYKTEEVNLLKSIRSDCGMLIEPWSSDDLQKAFDKVGIWYPTTARGNASFVSDWLNNHEHEFPRKIAQWRKTCKMRRDFIEGICIKQNHNGRIHAQFHALRKDSDGTRTGRFSSSTPNLQQIPARDDHWGPLVRSLFTPDEGTQWACLDYSQQEPRVLLHYAYLRKLRGSEEAVDLFNSDSSADFHQIVSDMANIPRKSAKTINLGMFYGMGIFKLSQQLGLEMNEAKPLFEKYHQRVPFVRALAQECSKAASTRGYIRTLLGRQRHFDLWEPSDSRNKWPNKEIPLSYDQALRVWEGRPLRRSFTHKALNALVQGSSADMIKKAMIDLHEAGIMPQITVHDEIDFSFNNNQDLVMAQEIMENCVKLHVPLKVDVETGPNWGDIK